MTQDGSKADTAFDVWFAEEFEELNPLGADAKLMRPVWIAGFKVRGEQIAARLRESAKDYDEWDSRIGDALRTLADEIGGKR